MSQLNPLSLFPCDTNSFGTTGASLWIVHEMDLTKKDLSGKTLHLMKEVSDYEMESLCITVPVCFSGPDSLYLPGILGM